MFLVGLTGGISTGKSTVAKIFKDHDIPIVDADLIARQVVEPNKKAWKKIRDAFGVEVFHDNGELNREALGKLIFDDIKKRKILNEITHPEIHKQMYKEIFTLLFQGHNFIVLDLPLLFETEVMLEFIHKVITVTCEEEIQLERLMKRNNYTVDEATKRIKSQMPLTLKCEKSNFVIENSSTMEFTERQTLDVLQMLLASNHHWRVRIYTGLLILVICALIYGLYLLFN